MNEDYYFGKTEDITYDVYQPLPFDPVKKCVPVKLVFKGLNDRCLERKRKTILKRSYHVRKCVWNGNNYEYEWIDI